MKRILLLLFSLLPALAFGQHSASGEGAFSLLADTGYNTVIFYNGKMEETREKGAAWALQLNLDAAGASTGRARLARVRDGATAWDVGYFVFNRIEPARSRYQGKCYWYYENNKLWREQQYVKGKR